MKVLIIKVSSMGDIIHTLPAVTDASNVVPNILFDWVVEETFSDIPRWHPAIHQIIPINLRFWIKNWYKLSSWKRYRECCIQLKKRYDVIIDAQGLLKTSLLITCITRGKKYGMDYTSVREPMSSFVYHERHYIKKSQHAVERIRQLFSFSLKYPVPSCIGKYNIAHLFPLQKNNVPYLIFFHSTTKLQKLWPEFNWSIIAQYAINAGYFIKLPFWTKSEELRTNQLARLYCNQIIILPKLTLQEIACQISGATAVISVDTGLSHLTAALGCPNVTLYGPTNPKLIGTYGQNQVALRSSTKKMKHLTPTHVWESLQKIIK
ncbi:lipopolysaccharide heptosyltransferase I [Blochmannia endosymbiont of Camponotus sp. C-003]|uniref:lipopolysaccharide heptosyltransferase I n=1 Tax=unclassified Candidatus Blochmanniella TaxID=711328 RepID=UPI002024DF51|nr:MULTISPECIES: lipopolysaccharide heptosyltransferase I [unclassified Candidatus Blochmannia]URJ23248.1 lipopolysaccharide heptosyltransferase I [Blochmannia endosymbiont of Camponotus sp. C-003]URJ28717.1 lipopolysaccharide heptosyltransferase I [Blochmannia endosymbiont of Camponotus sp. C-046]